VTRPPDDPEPTRELRPPVPGPADPPMVDQATEQVAMPSVQPEPTRPLGPVHAPRRSRTPFVVTALVLLILAVGVVAVLVWG
jgi:hypothetical protein